LPSGAAAAGIHNHIEAVASHLARFGNAFGRSGIHGRFRAEFFCSLQTLIAYINKEHIMRSDLVAAQQCKRAHGTGPHNRQPEERTRRDESKHVHDISQRFAQDRARRGQRIRNFDNLLLRQSDILRKRAGGLVHPQ
jgi:hypothetical protein